MKTSLREPAKRADGTPSIDGLSLLPITVIALGCPKPQGERLMSLQSAVARLIALICNIHLPLRRGPAALSRGPLASAMFQPSDF